MVHTGSSNCDDGPGFDQGMLRGFRYYEVSNTPGVRVVDMRPRVLCSFLDLMYAMLDVDPNKEVEHELKGRHIHLIFPFNLIIRVRSCHLSSVTCLPCFTARA